MITEPPNKDPHEPHYFFFTRHSTSPRLFLVYSSPTFPQLDFMSDQPRGHDPRVLGPRGGDSKDRRGGHGGRGRGGEISRSSLSTLPIVMRGDFRGDFYGGRRGGCRDGDYRNFGGLLGRSRDGGHPGPLEFCEYRNAAMCPQAQMSSRNAIPSLQEQISCSGNFR
ncbi:hypothetical protein DTO013E5_42 [Penicillium roqueforti]|nr:hypothetical protein DTO012A1_1577 [Penicillium roqueforti]KAI2756697.1 hypothetical protein DTO013F2_112 [Penicillium roqueforti]KAI2766156.1 hypothetical protein DTO012A8_8625 [Penicillium roqueforti]KAI3218203.1 hypothetical protein DTO013E5_42 [Penicillium roqueforti]KAI3226517.1 hypothetical protein CBS147310_8040 [Penicillium roqueforti]